MTPTYRVWAGMKQRCSNPNNTDYHNHGGRGITYDPRWKSYESFRNDMGAKPEGLTLERLDNEKGYSKENCCWASRTCQNNNRRTRIRGIERKDNSSGVPGVFQDKRRGTWYARVYVKGKPINLYCGPSRDKAIAIRQHYEVEQNEAIRNKQL